MMISCQMGLKIEHYYAYITNLKDEQLYIKSFNMTLADFFSKI